MKQHKWHKEIKAWADGAEIEVRQYFKHSNTWDCWKTIKVPKWSKADDVEYRIKPQPKLVPFDFSDAEQLIGKAVKSDSHKTKIFLITEVGESGIYTNAQIYPVYFDWLVKYYTFLDGSPCGKYTQD